MQCARVAASKTLPGTGMSTQDQWSIGYLLLCEHLDEVLAMETNGMVYTFLKYRCIDYAREHHLFPRSKHGSAQTWLIPCEKIYDRPTSADPEKLLAAKQLSRPQWKGLHGKPSRGAKIIETLIECGGDGTRAARRLGLTLGRISHTRKEYREWLASL